MRVSRFIIVFLAALFIVHIGYFFPRLPDSVASHFDGVGRPDSWMNKGGFLALEVVILGSLVFQFLGIPWLIEKMPTRWINLPNRDHWLAPKRREASLLTIRIFFEWFAAVTLMFFLFVNQLVFTANIQAGYLNNEWLIAILIAYFAFVAIWLIMLITRFLRKTQ